MTSLIGNTLGSYQIINEIGRGGMAIVYKAYHPTLERYVALKVLPPQFSFDTDFVKRFLLEARAAAKLKHPNIVTIYDVGEQNDLYYIVMELVEGGSLAQLIQREGQLAPARTANIIAQVASALDYAHALGFVHRDVKSSNVLTGANDHATLTDFGIVKAAEGTRVTRTGTMMGTPEYMAPEQIRGQAVDGRADIYALGIVCYEMLAGRVPFAGDTARVLYGQVHESPPPLATNSRAPRTIEQVLAGALAKDPNQRYARASDFSNALNQVANGIVPVTSRAAELPTRTVLRPQRESKSFVWLAAGIGRLGLFLFLLIFLSLNSRGTPDNSALNNSITVPAAALVTANTETASAIHSVVSTRTPSFTQNPSATPTRTRTPTPRATQRRGATVATIPAVTEPTQQSHSETRQSSSANDTVAMLLIDDGSKSFLIDKRPVSVTQFEKFIKTTGLVTFAEKQGFSEVYTSVESNASRRKTAIGASWRNPTGDAPADLNADVVQITFDEAQAYCQWTGKRLPTFQERTAATAHPDIAQRMSSYSLSKDNLFEFLDGNVVGGAHMAFGRLEFFVAQAGVVPNNIISLRCAKNSP